MIGEWRSLWNDPSLPFIYVQLAGFSDGKYRQLAERVEGAGLSATIVPNAGHNVHLERSDEFAALLLKVAIKSSAA